MQTEFANANQRPFKYSGFLEYKADGSLVRYSNTRELFLLKLNRWRGWKCWGGIDSFYIDYEMNLFVGQCKRGLIGNLKEEYDLPSAPFICDKDVCNCSQDMMESRKEKV